MTENNGRPKRITLAELKANREAIERALTNTEGRPRLTFEEDYALHFPD